MVGSSKILTVSYGTFSCTLEGFDDSFGTMKAIAEYFRDLAADDRYFGAEPPVPDAEMLARIAEREIARRVEARMDASGIVLRVGREAAAPAVQAAPEAPAPAAAPAAQAPSPVVGRAISHEERPITTARPAAAAPAVQAAQPGGVTGPEAEADHPVPSPLLAATGPVTDDAATLYFEDLVEDTVQDSLRITGGDTGETAPRAAALPDAEGPDVAVSEALVMPPVATLPAHPDPDSVAAKLQRIRAVVGRGLAAGAGPMAGFATDGDTEAAAPQEGAPDEVALDEGIEDDVALDEVAPEPMVAIDSAVAAEAETTVQDAPQDEGTDLGPDLGPDRGRVRARVIRMRRAEFDSLAPGLAGVAAAVADPSPADAGAASLDGAENGPDHAEEHADLEHAQDAADLADLALLDRLDTALTGDVAAASGSGASPEAADHDFDIDLGEGTLSPEDEAALLAELAEVGRDAAQEGPAMAQPMTDAVDEGSDDAGLAAIMAGLNAPEGEMAHDPADAMDIAEAGDRTADALFGTDLADILADEADLAMASDAADQEAWAREPAAGQTDGSADRDGAFDDLADAAMDLSEADLNGIEDEDIAAFLAAQGDDDASAATAPVLAADFDAVDDGADVGADVGADDGADDGADEAADEAAAAAVAGSAAMPLRAGRAVFADKPVADEAAMDRILSQTAAELAEPAASRRREAIAQLKAAVAATEAARRLGDTETEDDEVENAFRDDLRQVVRPRRAPRIEELRSERPRPAPLKLVASQRVDLPTAHAAAGPVRPRRVSLPAEAAAPAPVESRSAGSFADFAEQMGAHALPDLLEAAAAYTAFVEGIEDFSRPQLMKKVSQITPDGVSREDGLRSFGTLLRQGRIMKVRNGRFQVSGESRFNPERRAG